MTEEAPKPGAHTPLTTKKGLIYCKVCGVARDSEKWHKPCKPPRNGFRFKICCE